MNSESSMNAEERILIAIQSVAPDSSVAIARQMSHFGEHALGWSAAAAAGMGVAMLRGDLRARNRFAAAGLGGVAAHAASIAIKRVVRRPRPHHPDIEVRVSTPSKLSFPSSHATSSTAAAVLLGRAIGHPVLVPALVVPSMAASRLVLGVHYPSDVLVGTGVGFATAVLMVGSDRVISRTTDSAINGLSRSAGALRGHRRGLPQGLGRGRAQGKGSAPV